MQILSAAKDTAVALRSTLLTAAQVQGRSINDLIFQEAKTYESVSFYPPCTFFSIDAEELRFKSYYLGGRNKHKPFVEVG